MKKLGYIVAAAATFAIIAPTLASAETVIIKKRGYHDWGGPRAEFRERGWHDRGWHRGWDRGRDRVVIRDRRW